MLAAIAVCSSMLVPAAGIGTQPGARPSVEMGFQGDRVIMRVSYDRLEVVKLASRDGAVTVVLEAPRDRVAIEMSRTGLSVQRGGASASIAFGNAALLPRSLDDARRLLTGSLAVRQFRELVARLDHSGAKGVAVLELFLTESIVAIAEGELDAPSRLRGRIQQRREALAKQAGIRAVGLWIDQQTDCVTEYELELIKIDDQLEDCEESADQQEWFYERAAQRLLCHAEFIARSEGALFQFGVCSAFPTIAK